MYTLEFCDPRPPLGEFMPMMKRYHLVPDWWRESPEEALALHELRWLWRVRHDGAQVGWIWLDALVPGRSGVLGAVVDSAHRRRWHQDVLVELRELLWAVMTEQDVPRLSVVVPKGRLWAEMFFRKRLGFQFEGYARQSFEENGKPHDQVMLSLTQRDLKKIGRQDYESTRPFVVDYGRFGAPWPVVEKEAGPVQLPGDGGGSRAGGQGAGDDRPVAVGAAATV